jgi:flagellar hook assembly protein FlgD
MWKKFLAVMAITGLLTTNAFALDVNLVPGNQVDGEVVSYIDNFTAPANFDPVNDKTTTLSFDLAFQADLYAYVANASYDIVATFDTYATTQPGSVSYTWNGRAGNVETGSILPDGTYTYKVFARVGEQIVDFDYQDVTLKSLSEVNEVAPKVSNLKADPLAFSAEGDEDTEISFEVDKDAYLEVTVKKDGTVVKEFDDYDGNDWYKKGEVHSINWNGTDNDGDVLADAVYTIYVVASNTDGSNTSSTEVEIKTTAVVSNGIIQDFTLDPKGTWDPTDEDLEIAFELTESAKSLMIEAKNGNKVIGILDDDYVDDDEYEELWDGTDDDGDYVKEGVWEIIVRADGNKVSRTVTVEYEKPEITSAFVTKDSFDPSNDEFSNLVFKLDAPALVTVDIYRGSKKEFTLLDEETVKKNRYYAVSWDGMDEDGDEVDFAKDWKFKITAENLTDDDVYSTETVEVDVEEDEVSDKKANVTNDYTAPIVFDDNGYDTMEISYCVDADAEVYLAIYEGTSTSGSADAEILDYVSMEAGCHTEVWDGKNENGKTLKDGVYTYKLTSKIGSYKETEIGKFVIGNSGTVDTTTPEEPADEEPTDETPYIGECSNYYWDLGYLGGDNELCEAIAWVTEEGIFSGYQDGTFKPYQKINRAEVLKVVLEAFNVDLYPLNGSKEGFSDVDPYSWYMSYVRTAKAFGMLDGYSDGTARLSNNINRVELLKFVLEASSSFTGYEFVTGYYYPNYYYDFYADVAYDSDSSWFYDYANAAYTYDLYNTYYEEGKEYLKPAQLVERGEVALLLYRMANAGLL